MTNSVTCGWSVAHARDLEINGSDVHGARGRQAARDITLLVALVMIDVTDVVFAVDSCPAIPAVTRETFYGLRSERVRHPGLRSLYFAVAGMMAMLRYLKVQPGLILAFVGVKMLLLGELFEIHLPTFVSLAVIAGARRGDPVVHVGRRPPRCG